MTRTYLVAVPVVPVLLALDRYPDQRGRYFCVFHEDERPGGKPSAEVRSDPCLLECWSCGAMATAAELVAQITGCTRLEGAQRALDIAGTVEPTASRPRPPVSAAQLEAEFLRQTQGVRYPRDTDPVSGFADARGWPEGLAAYVRSQWGWAGDYRGRVVMPYRDVGGALIGLRWRIPPYWEKSGRPRSRFTSLYGAWRLNGASEVWLTEGETDTVWAAWHLEPEGVGVVGLPGGRYLPRPDDLELLAGRTVVIVTDTDTVGNEARDRWQRALTGVATTIGLRLEGVADLCASFANPLELRRLYGER